MPDRRWAAGDQLLSMTGADQVNAADIRRRLEVLGWDCALHSDEDVARVNGYRTTPAPATMLVTWAMPAYWEPGDPPRWTDGAAVIAASPAVQLCGPDDEVVATEIDTDYLAPIYPGDSIRSSTAITKITQKTTALGAGEFIAIETNYTNQSGEVVGVERMTVFRYHRTGAQQ